MFYISSVQVPICVCINRLHCEERGGLYCISFSGKVHDLWSLLDFLLFPGLRSSLGLSTAALRTKCTRHGKGEAHSATMSPSRCLDRKVNVNRMVFEAAFSNISTRWRQRHSKNGS